MSNRNGWVETEFTVKSGDRYMLSLQKINSYEDSIDAPIDDVFTLAVYVESMHPPFLKHWGGYGNFQYSELNDEEIDIQLNDKQKKLIDKIRFFDKKKEIHNSVWESIVELAKEVDEKGGIQSARRYEEPEDFANEEEYVDAKYFTPYLQELKNSLIPIPGFNIIVGKLWVTYLGRTVSIKIFPRWDNPIRLSNRTTVIIHSERLGNIHEKIYDYTIAYVPEIDADNIHRMALETWNEYKQSEKIESNYKAYTLEDHVLYEDTIKDYLYELHPYIDKEMRKYENGNFGSRAEGPDFNYFRQPQPGQSISIWILPWADMDNEGASYKDSLGIIVEFCTDMQREWSSTITAKYTFDYKLAVNPEIDAEEIVNFVRDAIKKTEEDYSDMKKMNILRASDDSIKSEEFTITDSEGWKWVLILDYEIAEQLFFAYWRPAGDNDIKQGLTDASFNNDSKTYTKQQIDFMYRVIEYNKYHEMPEATWDNLIEEAKEIENIYMDKDWQKRGTEVEASEYNGIAKQEKFILIDKDGDKTEVMLRLNNENMFLAYYRESNQAMWIVIKPSNQMWIDDKLATSSFTDKQVELFNMLLTYSTIYDEMNEATWDSMVERCKNINEGNVVASEINVIKKVFKLVDKKGREIEIQLIFKGAHKTFTVYFKTDWDAYWKPFGVSWMDAMAYLSSFNYSFSKKQEELLHMLSTYASIQGEMDEATWDAMIERCENINQNDVVASEDTKFMQKEMVLHDTDMFNTWIQITWRSGFFDAYWKVTRSAPYYKHINDYTFMDSNFSPEIQDFLYRIAQYNMSDEKMEEPTWDNLVEEIDKLKEVDTMKIKSADEPVVNMEEAKEKRRMIMDYIKDEIIPLMQPIEGFNVIETPSFFQGHIAYARSKAFMLVLFVWLDRSMSFKEGELNMSIISPKGYGDVLATYSYNFLYNAEADAEELTNMFKENINAIKDSTDEEIEKLMAEIGENVTEDEKARRTIKEV